MCGNVPLIGCGKVGGGHIERFQGDKKFKRIIVEMMGLTMTQTSGNII